MIFTDEMPYHLVCGNSLDVLKTLPDNSVDSCVTDPPYEIGFMGKSWDSSGIANSVELWSEVLRVLKPGGYVVSFSAARTYHRMACAIEDAGFEIRDQIMWIYGCLDTETQVATIDGVKHYHETKIGELVLCYDAVNNEYTYQPILEIVEYDYNDTAYRITGDFGEQVVSRNHRCIIERNGKEVFNFAETLESEVHVPFLESLSELQQAVFSSKSNSSIAEQNKWATQGIRKWKGHKTALVRVVPFQYVGKVWCLRVPTGAFVAVRNGVAFPTGNSGFPKSMNISKAIDNAAGAAREVVGVRKDFANRMSLGERPNTANAGGYVNPQAAGQITASATEDAKKWDGWGTALKPAHEPICVARKPLSEKTVAANVLKFGVGAINIDGCRIDGDTDIGRWPANLIHDGSDEVIANFPGDILKDKNASKFFYCPKASKEDRNSGCDELADQQYSTDGRKTPIENAFQRNNSVAKNNHPTVKPHELMKYLVRLFTPKGGIVLSPFNGSGSCGKAAIAEGMRYIGVDLDQHHIDISHARILHMIDEISANASLDDI